MNQDLYDYQSSLFEEEEFIEEEVEFPASSMTPTTSWLPLEPELPIPKVFYTPAVHDEIEFLVNYCKKEVSWMGLVKSLDNNQYLIHKLYIPVQEVSATESDVSADNLLQLAAQVMNDGHNIEELFYHGHSHVNMRVSPSAQDQSTIKTFLETAPYFIRGIYNKQGDAKVDVFNKFDQRCWQCVTNKVYTDPLPANRVKELKKIIKENVTEQKVLFQKSLPKLPTSLQPRSSTKKPAKKKGRMTKGAVSYNGDNYFFPNNYGDN